MVNAHQWRIVGENTWHSLYDGLWQEGHGTLYWGGRKTTDSFEEICAQCQKKLASSDSVVHYAFSPSKKEDGRFYCWEHSPVPIELRNPEVTYRGVLRLDERGVLVFEQEEGEPIMLASMVAQHLASRGAWLVVNCALCKKLPGSKDVLVRQHLTEEGPSGAKYLVYQQIPGSQEPQRIDEVWNVNGRNVLGWLKEWSGYSLSMTILYTPEIEQYPVLRYQLVDVHRDGTLWMLVNTNPHRVIQTYWVEDFREGQAECNHLNREENARSRSSVLGEVALVLKSAEEHREREQRGETRPS